jgi:NADH-quinone oxidoreductase subunit J
VGSVILILAGLILVAALVSVTARAIGNYIYFWIFTAVALGGAVRVVTHPRPVYSALYFILTVFASAGLFVLLSAGFMAAALVLIYAGAILITYVFVIMLAAQASGEATGTTTVLRTSEYDAVSREPFVACAVGFALMGVLLFIIFDKAQGLTGPSNRRGHVVAAQIQDDAMIANASGETQKLGVYLFQNQLVNLELAGLLLTLSMVGAILIARRRVITSDQISGGTPEMVTATATPINDDPFSIPVYGTKNPQQKAYPET